MFVDANLTLGAYPAFFASIHLSAHKHQASPGLSPGKLNSFLGVDKSLPFDFENSRNSSVIIAHTVCVPISLFPVLQQPSRKNPVKGSTLHGTRSKPRTFFWFCINFKFPWLVNFSAANQPPFALPCEERLEEELPLVSTSRHTLNYFTLVATM